MLKLVQFYNQQPNEQSLFLSRMNELIDYTERTGDVSIIWHNSYCIERLQTRKGVLIEFIVRPNWGLACFMNNTIQSGLCDEKIYHSRLVEGSVDSDTRRVCIFGGGEGATARTVLAHENVQYVDMIDWDEDVVGLFKTKFRQWGQDTWDDPRLHIQYADAFEVCKEQRTGFYDSVIVDLFDVEEEELSKWTTFLEYIAVWTNSAINIYVGTHVPFINTRTGTVAVLRKVLRRLGFSTKVVSVYIPSFNGYSIFLKCIKKQKGAEVNETNQVASESE